MTLVFDSDGNGHFGKVLCSSDNGDTIIMLVGREVVTIVTKEVR